MSEYQVVVEPRDDNIRIISASIELEDGRYHFWFNGETMCLNTPILYKNPPRNQANAFKTRKLDATSSRNAKIIARMMFEITEKKLVIKIINEMAEKKTKADHQAYIHERVRTYWAQLMRETVNAIARVSPEEFQIVSGELANFIMPKHNSG